MARLSLHLLGQGARGWPTWRRKRIVRIAGRHSPGCSG